MTTKKIESIIWGIIVLILLIFAMIHPRIIYFIMAIVCGIIGTTRFFSKKEKTRAKLFKDTVGNIIGILILCYLGQYLNIIFPNHASYEYKTDIMSLKAESPEEYYQFPDNIPDSASKVKWVCLPNFLQGTGYHKLFFYEDTSYLKDIYETYAGQATIYTYVDYSWWNAEMDESTSFPGETEIPEHEKMNVQVLMLYDNQETTHYHNSGLYINQTEKYVCFFAQ
jgi:hypothetical protein